MKKIRTVAWITPGYISRFKKRFETYAPRSSAPDVTAIEPKWNDSCASLFGAALTNEAEILLVMTHGAKPDGAGPGVISPTDHASSWSLKRTVLGSLNGKEVKARGVIDLACNREEKSGNHTNWLALGDDVEWFIAARESVSDNASGRALEAALKYGGDDPERILLDLQRWTPKANWWLKTRSPQRIA